MYRIGYVDEDEGQRNSFYHFLKDDFEIILFEINEDSSEETIVEDIFTAGLDILVLDFRLDESGVVDFNSDSLVEQIQKRNLHFPLVILTSHEIDALDHLSDANLVNGKDEMLGGKVKVFIQKLNKIATGYKSKLNDTKVKLEGLEKKRTEGSLLPAEEDEYVRLNTFIDETITAEDRISRSFYSEDTNTKLDELINKTEELLNKIPDKK